MKSVLLGGLAAFALTTAMSASAANAEEVTLRFATTNPSFVHLNKEVLHPWAKQINDSSKGVLQIDVRDGPTIANHRNYYDRVKSDVVQIAWGLQSTMAAQLPLSQSVTLPFLIEDSQVASTAFWRVMESGGFGSEYADGDVAPLFMIVFPNSQLHLRTILTKWDTLDGQKVSTTTRPVAQFLSAVGAAPVSIIISEAYEAIQRGTVDGVVTPYTAMQPFKLHEVTKFHLEAPLGGAGAHVIMSRKKLNSLPAEARRILVESSGEKQSRLFGTFWDKVLNSGKKMVEDAGGHKIAQLTPEQTAVWKKKADVIAAEWAKSVPGGDKALDAYKAELAKVTAGK